jgi:hypothetical protein
LAYLKYYDVFPDGAASFWLEWKECLLPGSITDSSQSPFRPFHVGFAPIHVIPSINVGAPKRTSLVGPPPAGLGGKPKVLLQRLRRGIADVYLGVSIIDHGMTA